MVIVSLLEISHIVFLCLLFIIIIIIIITIMLQVVFQKKHLTHILNCVLCLGIWELLFII